MGDLVAQLSQLAPFCGTLYGTKTLQPLELLCECHIFRDGFFGKFDRLIQDLFPHAVLEFGEAVCELVQQATLGTGEVGCTFRREVGLAEFIQRLGQYFRVQSAFGQGGLQFFRTIHSATPSVLAMR